MPDKMTWEDENLFPLPQFGWVGLLLVYGFAATRILTRFAFVITAAWLAVLGVLLIAYALIRALP